MAKKRKMVQAPIWEKLARQMRKPLKMDAHSAQKLLTKHSEADVGRGQALPSRDLVAQLGNPMGVFDLERNLLIRDVATSDIRIESISTQFTHGIPKRNSRWHLQPR